MIEIVMARELETSADDIASKIQVVFSGSMQAGHLAILAISDSSTSTLRTCSSAGSGRPAKFARYLDPADDGVFCCLPLTRYGTCAAPGKPLVKCQDGSKCISFSDSDISRGAGCQKFRAEAIEQMAGFFYRAARSGSHQRQRVTGFQQADRIAHGDLANMQRDFALSGNGHLEEFAPVPDHYARAEGEMRVAA